MPLLIRSIRAWSDKALQARGGKPIEIRDHSVQDEQSRRGEVTVK